MAKTKAKRLLSLLLSLAMVFSLTVAPVYATDTSGDTLQVTEASATDEAAQDPAASSDGDSSGEAESSEEKAEESGDTAGEDTDNGISVASTEAESSSSSTETTTTYDASNGVASVTTKTGDTETTTYYGSLADAIDAVTSSKNQTVTLLKDVTLTETLKIYKSLTLDLGNYKISGDFNDKLIYTTQSLTINADENGGVTATTGAAIYNQKGQGDGTLTINGGTYVSSSTHAIFNNNGIVRVNGGSISTAVSDKDGIYCSSDATVTVNGGTVSGARYGVYSTYALSVTGGTISGSKCGVYFKYGTAVTVSGGSIEGGTEGLTEAAESTTSTEENAIATVAETDDTATIQISGGEFEGVKHAVSVRSTTTVSGGTFAATGSISDYAVGFYLNGATVTFSGGTFSGAYGAAWINGTTGGTINYVSGYGAVDAEGKTANLNDRYTDAGTTMVRTVVLVSPVATITVDDTTTKYASIAAAIEAAGENDTTITLVASTSEDVVIPSGADITLDLNGCTLTNSASHTITNYGTLTIQGTGTVDNVTHGKGALVNYGTATLLGGTYKRSAEAGASSSDNGGNSWYTIKNYGEMTIGDKDAATCSVVVENKGSYSSCVANGYQNTNDKTTAQAITGTETVPTLTIYGGTFSGGIATIKNDDCAELTINGGEFKNTSQLVIMNHSTATITGGTFTGEAGVDVIYNCGCDSNLDVGVLTITGGTFTAADGQYAVVDVSTENTAKVTIESGTFTGAIGATTDTATWTVTGGSYSDDSADEYLSGTEYQLAKKGNGAAEDGPAYYVTSVFTGKSLDLSSGKITLKVYFNSDDVNTSDLSGELEDDEESFANIEFDANAKKGTFSLNVSAEMMANTATFTITLNNGYVVTYETSVKEVANAYLSDAEYGKYHVMLKAMLNYGAALQTYGNYNADDLANKGNEFTDSDLTSASTSAMCADGAKLVTYTQADYSGAVISSMNIVFNYDFTVKLTYSEAIDGDGTVTAVTLNSENVSYNVSGKVVTISGLSAAELGQTISITTKDSSGKLKMTTLPGLYYAYLLASKTDDANSQLLGQTLYVYSKAVSALS